MKSPIVLVVLVALFLIAILSPPFGQLSSGTTQTAFQKTEAAYRANNIGVALLEQYKAREAVDSFRRALEIKPDLVLARINLAIALYYLPHAEGAKHEAEKALTLKPDAPQPHYILGLIARAQNRFDDAVAEFQKVLQIDPNDVGANVNSGQILLQQKRHAEAIAAFRRAFAAEPYNETALYNLGLLLTRTGKREEGQQLLKKFQQLKQSGAGTSIGNNYLEGGRYAEAVVSTGLEAGLVDKGTSPITFTDVTEKALPPFRVVVALRSKILRAAGGAATLFDYDGDGDLDLIEVQSGAQRLFQNEGGRFSEVTVRGSDLAKDRTGVATAVIAGDYDNDGKQDLFVLRYGESSLYHNEGNNRFSDVTAAAKIPKTTNLSRSAAFFDYDHDGDLDILIGGGGDVVDALKIEKDLDEHPPKSLYTILLSSPAMRGWLLRNNGNGAFKDETIAALLGSVVESTAVVPTDYDNRRDIDLLVTSGAGVSLYRNMRDGTFKNVAQEVSLGPEQLKTTSSVAVGDLNKDGYPDFFFGLFDWAGYFALSDGAGRFRVTRGPDAFNPQLDLRSGKSNQASLLLDYDNDGLLDLVTLVTCCGEPQTIQLRIWRNIGDGWKEVTADTVRSISAKTAGGGRPLLIGGDLDGDGDTDLIFGSVADGLHVLRNDGGNRNRSVKVNLHGRVSNRSAVQTKVEMRAGSLYQKLETYSASPAPAPADLIFGLGKRERPDAIRVLWPAGIVQSETEFPESSSTRFTLDITELDRKPSSCPYLYAWNGKRFEFVTDFMGGGEMGYLEAPGHYNKPDPDEYVRITADQLKEKDGRYELRVTNELEEALFVDRLQLLAVTHPIGTEVSPNEGMTAAPKPFKLFVTQNARPPLSANDDHGHDVLDLISRIDRRWPDDFKVDRIRGYAEEHALTLSLAEPSRVQSSKSKVLLLTGWTDYAWSSDNVAATQAGKAMKPPALQVKDRSGAWRTVIEDIGIPVGRPQTVTVDLTGKFLSDKREVRIVTNMRIYWDQILVSESDETSPGRIVKLDPIDADLRWRGYSAEMTPDGCEPFGYDYQRVSFISPWKVMTGRYTREGDVRELLLNTDDIFVICRTGDEISLSFDAMRLPRLPAGWTRTFLLYSDGFSKEMDINSASPDQVGPLPFHGMSRYPYKWPERYPLTEASRNYLEKYNTRVVTAPVPRLSVSSSMFQVSSWSSGSK